MPSTISHQPIIRQASLPLRVSARAVLSGIEFAHNLFGQDNESIIDRYLDATREDHIRFVFNLSAGRHVQEPRFWNTELIELSHGERTRLACPEGASPDRSSNSVLSPKFTIHQAIQEILGARENFARAEIGIQWSLSSNLLTDLIRAGHLKQTGARLLRPDLEQFLLSRWIGSPQSRDREGASNRPTNVTQP